MTTESKRELLVVLGNQLFPVSHLPNVNDVFMCESQDLCTHFRYHKHKIVFFLSSMRHYKQELEAEGRKVTYLELDQNSLSFISSLDKFVHQKNTQTVHVFEIEDKFMEQQLVELCQKRGINLITHKSPMFLVSREQFKSYLSSVKKPFMKTFYERERKRLGVLMDKNGKPAGGQYSFDTENRKYLPTEVQPPSLPRFVHDQIDQAVMALVNSRFKDHPGQVENFWLPTNRADAKKFATDFLKNRLNNFGDYEDAITNRSDFVYHSSLSPVINIGLITPEQLLQAALKASSAKDLPLNSVEGFIRQVMGWREFVRGIYQNYSDQQQTSNFFGHDRKLTLAWYQGSTGIRPLDDAIKKANRLSYNHHIERLMIISNMMNLSRIHPHEVHRWFMEMYVDSSDWVMGPNVYGMGLFSDGGIFATKPYICGSNYILKMTKDYKKEPWCEVMDGLYWSFIDTNRDFFSKNPRLSMMVKTFDKKSKEKRQSHIEQARNFIDRKTEPL